MPLTSVQELLNASLSASGIRIQAGNVDANLLRVSAVEGTQSGAGYANITAASAINVLAGKGILESLIFNTSTTARVVLYDSVSFGANIIGTIDGMATKGEVVKYHAPVSAGITISAVSAPGDLTITFVAL